MAECPGQFVDKGRACAPFDETSTRKPCDGAGEEWFLAGLGKDSEPRLWSFPRVWAPRSLVADMCLLWRQLCSPLRAAFDSPSCGKDHTAPARGSTRSEGCATTCFQAEPLWPTAAGPQLRQAAAWPAWDAFDCDSSAQNSITRGSSNVDSGSVSVGASWSLSARHQSWT